MKPSVYSLFKAAALVSVATLAGVALADPFPAPHGVATLEQIEQGLDAWRGKPMAFPGRVLRVEEGYEGRPLLRVLLPKPNPEQRQIWVSSQVPAEQQQFHVGDVVIVYGKIELADEDDPVTTPVYDTTYHLLGECVVNATKMRVYASPQAAERCQSWRQGQWPES